MSIQKEVTAKVPQKKDDEGNVTQEAMEATIFVNYAETVEEAVEMFGAEALLSNAFANWRVTLQSNIRSSLKSGLTPDQVHEKLSSAVMGVAQAGVRMDPQAAFIAKFKMATPEQQAEMLEKLKDAAEG